MAGKMDTAWKEERDGRAALRTANDFIVVLQQGGEKRSARAPTGGTPLVQSSQPRMWEVLHICPVASPSGRGEVLFNTSRALPFPTLPHRDPPSSRVALTG